METDCNNPGGAPLSLLGGSCQLGAPTLTEWPGGPGECYGKIQRANSECGHPQRCMCGSRLTESSMSAAAWPWATLRWHVLLKDHGFVHRNGRKYQGQDSLVLGGGMGWTMVMCCALFL